MSFLLGAFGKLAAGRRVRDLQARMMRVQTRLRRATRQVETMSKMIETQKKMELNMLSVQASQANAGMLGAIRNTGIFTPEQLNLFSGGGSWAEMSEADRAAYGQFTQMQTQLKANNEITLAQLKQQIEEKYENMNDFMLEPLKQEQDSLQTEKDSLESQLQIANADYEACKKMESADAKHLAPNYTGQG
jgi:hypothetical protein